MLEFILQVNKKHTDPEKYPRKIKGKNKVVVVVDKKRDEKIEKYQPPRFDDGSHEIEEVRSFDFHYKTLKIFEVTI